MNQIGKNIRAKRKQKEISQEELAESLHVTRQAISNWETGKTQPDLETLERLASAFECDIQDIIYGTKPKISVEQSLEERRRYIRNMCIWGGMALILWIGLIWAKPYLLDGYYRLSLTPYLCSELFLWPFFYFAAGFALMYGLGIIAPIRVQNQTIRKTLLWGLCTLLGIYAVFSVILLGVHIGWIFLPEGIVHPLSWMFSRLLQFHEVFVLLGIGVFLGMEK